MPAHNRYPEKQIASFAVVGAMGVVLCFTPVYHTVVDVRMTSSDPGMVETSHQHEVAAPEDTQAAP